MSQIESKWKEFALEQVFTEWEGSSEEVFDTFQEEPFYAYKVFDMVICEDFEDWGFARLKVWLLNLAEAAQTVADEAFWRDG